MRSVVVVMSGPNTLPVETTVSWSVKPSLSETVSCSIAAVSTTPISLRSGAMPKKLYKEVKGKPRCKTISPSGKSFCTRWKGHPGNHSYTTSVQYIKKYD